MKQKIVIKVEMNCEKCRSKAMKIAVAADGVSDVAIRGAGKDELMVIGEGVDSVKLTSSLRKKLRNANIISVQEEKAKADESQKKQQGKEENKKKQEEGKKKEDFKSNDYNVPYYVVSGVAVQDPNPPPFCSIL